MTTRDQLRLRATVLSYFDIGWLGGDSGDELALEEFLAVDCERVRTPDGMRRWSLEDAVRRTVASRAGVAGLREAWETRSHKPKDARQWAIDQFIGHGRLPDLADLGRERLTALQTVARWLGAAEGMPDRREVEDQLQFSEFLLPLANVATDHFVGREALLRHLEIAAKSGSRVVIHGSGGIGKSALVAEHIIRTVRRGGVEIAYLNFDDSSLDPAQPTSLLWAIASQFSWQLTGSSYARVARVARAARDRLTMGDHAREVQTRGVQVRESNVEDLLSDLAASLGTNPCLVVIDTLEEVQRRDGPVIRAFLTFVESLARVLANSQIVIAGRAPMRFVTPGGTFARTFEDVNLVGLERLEAEDLLRHLLAGAADIDVADVVRQVGTSPLSLRLAAGVLRNAPADEALRDICLYRGRIDGELYRRLLGHIRNPDVRRLAHPGLTLRRVTPQLILEVLAKPCQVEVPGWPRAWKLFDGLAREAMLVERSSSDQSVVVHRQDVRSIMLGPLAADMPDVVESIHRRAAVFYDRSDDLVSRTEAMYHRLMLGRRERTLDTYWDPSLLPGLLSSLDEMPAASKAYLAGRSDSLGVSDADLRHAEQETKRRLVVRRVEGLVADGHIFEALRALDDHIDATGDSSTAVIDQRVQLLELGGDLAGALHLGEDELLRAARLGKNEDFFLFTFHVARLAERLGDPPLADAKLGTALRLAQLLPPTSAHRLVELRLRVARLGLARRAGLSAERSDEDDAREVVALYDELQVRTIRKVPGLLRDLAAEVGAQAPHVLGAALKSIGLDVTDEGGDDLVRVLGDNREIAATITKLAGQPSFDKPPADLGAWVHTQERGELGANIADLLDALQPDLSPGVAEAVGQEYASESDAAIAYEPERAIGEDEAYTWQADDSSQSETDEAEPGAREDEWG